MPQSSSEILSRFPFATVDKSGIDLGCSFALWGYLAPRKPLDMSNTLRIKKGVDIRLTGEPSFNVVTHHNPRWSRFSPPTFLV